MTIRTRYKQLKNRDWLHEQYAVNKRSAPDIAEEVGCHSDAVRRALKHHRIDRRAGGGVFGKDYQELNDREWLIRQHVDLLKTGHDIAKELGCSTATVYEALRRQDVRISKGSPVGSVYPELQDRGWLHVQYVTEKKSGADIALEIGCDKSAVYRAIKRHGIQKREHTSRYALLNNKEWLRNAYVNERRSVKSIAKEVGASAGNVQSHLSTMGIRLRGVKEAVNIVRPKGKRHGENAANWQGGRRKTKAGYIYIYTPDHPYSTKAGYVMEHRLVMEEKIGRYLEQYEVVHHVDGNKSNNDIGNLELKTNGKHISDHFKASHEVAHLRQENNQLRRENNQLRKNDKKLQGRVFELEKELHKLREQLGN